MSPVEMILSCVVLVGAGKAAVSYIYKKDEEGEDRRRGAAQMAAKLSNLGLVKIPEFLIDYSVKDRSAMASKLKNVATTFLAGDAAVLEEFAGIFDNLLKAKLNSETGRAYIAAKLRDAIRSDDSTAVQESPAPRLTI